MQNSNRKTGLHAQGFCRGFCDTSDFSAHLTTWRQLFCCVRSLTVFRNIQTIKSTLAARFGPKFLSPSHGSLFLGTSMGFLPYSHLQKSGEPPTPHMGSNYSLDTSPLGVLCRSRTAFLCQKWPFFRYGVSFAKSSAMQLYEPTCGGLGVRPPVRVGLPILQPTKLNVAFPFTTFSRPRCHKSLGNKVKILCTSQTNLLEGKESRLLHGTLDWIKTWTPFHRSFSCDCRRRAFH